MIKIILWIAVAVICLYILWKSFSANNKCPKEDIAEDFTLMLLSLFIRNFDTLSRIFRRVFAPYADLSLFSYVFASRFLAIL